MSFEVAQIFKKATLIIGYNIYNFDIPFLKNRDKYLNDALSSEYPLYVDLIDYIKNKIRKERVSLSQCCDYYDVINNTPHVGKSDCEATLDCFYKALKLDGITIDEYKIAVV